MIIIFVYKLNHFKIYISAELSINMLNKESKVSISVGDMTKDSLIKHIVYIRAHKVGDRNIIIKVRIYFFISQYINYMYMYVCVT